MLHHGVRMRGRAGAGTEDACRVRRDPGGTRWGEGHPHGREIPQPGLLRAAAAPGGVTTTAAAATATPAATTTAVATCRSVAVTATASTTLSRTIDAVAAAAAVAVTTTIISRVDGEDLCALCARPLIEGELGEHQTRPSLGEGGQRDGGLDDRRLELELLAEAVQHLQGKGTVGDRFPNVSEGRSNALEATAIVVDGLVPTHGRPELLAEVHRELGFILEEVFVEALPDGVGGGAGRCDDVEKIAGDGGEKPQDDRVVVIMPAGVGEACSGAVGDVVLGVEAGEDEVEIVALADEAGAVQREFEVDYVGDTGGEGLGRSGGEWDGKRDVLERVGRAGGKGQSTGRREVRGGRCARTRGRSGGVRYGSSELLGREGWAVAGVCRCCRCRPAEGRLG